MFEEDNEGYGLYGFNPQTMDPQATNAINTELGSILRKLIKPKQIKGIRAEMIERLCRQTFMKIEGIPSLDELLLQDL